MFIVSYIIDHLSPSRDAKNYTFSLHAYPEFLDSVGQ